MGRNFRRARLEFGPREPLCQPFRPGSQSKDLLQMVMGGEGENEGKVTFICACSLAGVNISEGCHAVQAALAALGVQLCPGADRHLYKSGCVHVDIS